MSAVMRTDSRIEQLRVPPQSIEAEQNVLGGIMLCADTAAFEAVADLLTPDDFYRRDHQLIFRALRELADKKIPLDAVTVGEWFDSQGLSDQIGGDYLIELAANTVSAANIRAYAEIVWDKGRLRKLIDVGTDLVNWGFRPEGRDTDEIANEALRAVAEIGGVSKADIAKTPKTMGRQWFDSLQARYSGTFDGVATPYAKLNSRIGGGLHAGELAILAARPSMGKSALALNIGLSAAMSSRRTMVFSLEMTADAIYNRCIATLNNIPLEWLRRPNDEIEEYWTKAAAGVKRMREAELVVDDQGAISVDQVCARARREHRKNPLRLIVVDHAHIMRLPGKTRTDIELGDVSGQLKALAKELNCAVLMLAQLNRSVEKRTNKRPMMSDLREAGAFEQDADLIMFLYRDDYYAAQEERASEFPGFVEVIIGKQREGETGKEWLRSALQFGRIDDYDGPAPKAPEAPKKGERWSGYDD